MSNFEIISVVVAVIALLPLVPFIRWIDKRYTLMKDFNNLKKVIYETHIDSYEERIEKLDEDISLLTCKDTLSKIDKNELAHKKSRRDKYIRKLERIK